MKSNLFAKENAKWFVPTLMLIVFLVQIIGVSQFDFSRRKGAGMGMYSTYIPRVVILNETERQESIFIPESVGSYEQALSIFPIAFYSDRLVEKMQDIVFYDENEQLYYKQHFSFEEEIDSYEFISLLHRKKLRELNEPNLTTVDSISLTVVGVGSYSPETGKVVPEILFSKNYPAYE